MSRPAAGGGEGGPIAARLVADDGAELRVQVDSGRLRGPHPASSGTTQSGLASSAARADLPRS